MMTIGLISDTHGAPDNRIVEFLKGTDEIWHAGDMVSLDAQLTLAGTRIFRGVYGNVDGQDVRLACPEYLSFMAEGVRVLMMHIGGYPGRYDHRARALIEKEQPGLFICGHSHILKVIYDHKYRMLTVNPGAAGNYGIHRSITALRFVIDGTQIRDMEVLDIPR